MGSIAGIIYPSAYQMTELIENMSCAFSSSGVRKGLRAFHYKNLEVGSWDAGMGSNERKTIWAVVDGTIYNSSELKKILKDEFSLSAETDADLLVHAYEAWKEKFIERLNGPFAFALFDEEKEILLLARDRIGQKTLYWTAQGDYWLFSSQIKGLLASGLVPQNPANEALAAYFYFGYVPQDLTAIKGINKLLPGHYLKIDLKRQLAIRQYWSLSALLENKHEMSESEAYDEFGHYLEDAVRVAIPEKDNFSSELNNELGSFCLNWFLAHLVKKDRYTTITTAFEVGNQEQEIAGSQLFSTKFGLKHIVKNIRADEILQDIVQIVWHLDEPIADPGVILTWHLGCTAAANGSKLFADCGWEEMLAGHARYFINRENINAHPSMAYQVAHFYPALRANIIHPILSAFSPKFKLQMLRNIDIDRDLMTYLLYIALFKGKNRKKASPHLYPYFDPEAFTQRFHRLNFVAGSIEPSLYFDIKTELPDRLLLQYERLLSSHGVDLIAPFLDPRLVAFFARLPETIKFGKNIPAVMLQKLFEKLCLPSPPVHGTGSDLINYLCQNPHFRDIFGMLESGRLAEEDIVSPKWIRKKLSYPELIPVTFTQLWSLLILEIWFRLYINRPIGSQNYQVEVEDLLTRK